MTDPTELHLLRGIIANPADDTARVVYADWLDEHAGTKPCPEKGCGNPARGWNGFYRCRTCAGTGTVSDGRHERAELIRVQVGLSRKGHLSDGTPCPCQVCSGLRERERELLTADRRREWARVPCPDCAGEAERGRKFRCGTCRSTGDVLMRSAELSVDFEPVPTHFRRGFVYRVEVPALSWLFERHGVSYGRSDSQQAWRVTQWALAVASANPVTEFGIGGFVTEPWEIEGQQDKSHPWVWRPEGGVGGERERLIRPLFDAIKAPRKTVHGAYYPDREAALLALATAAADVVRAAVLASWGQEVRT